MKEHPILMSAPMVRACLREINPKSQTRRIVKWRGVEPGLNLSFSGLRVERSGSNWVLSSPTRTSFEYRSVPMPCPYGHPGDRLWVRETWRITTDTVDEARALTEDIMSGSAVDWRATYIDKLMKHGFSREDAEMADDFETWRPSIHMPRWASRITLEITDVRVERLQDISEADALAEGIVAIHDGFGLPDGSHFHAADPRESYWSLWEAINGAGSVMANPWVWVVEFEQTVKQE